MFKSYCAYVEKSFRVYDEKLTASMLYLPQLYMWPLMSFFGASNFFVFAPVASSAVNPEVNEIVVVVVVYSSLHSSCDPDFSSLASKTSFPIFFVSGFSGRA